MSSTCRYAVSDDCLLLADVSMLSVLIVCCRYQHAVAAEKCVEGVSTLLVLIMGC